MKVRLFATVGVFLLSQWLLTGCAGNQTVSETFNSSNRPQLLISGATRAEVKGLAMGAARAKGWALVKSTDDLLVVARPLDNASPTAVALGAGNSTIPPVIEVTSAFSEQSGGTNVSVAAVLVSQPPGEQAAKRTDYTENYRDALTQSLEALRSNWTANRRRVANGLPPLSSPSAAGAPGDQPRVNAWGEAAAKEPAANDAAGTISPAPPLTAAPEPRLPESQPIATPPTPAAPVAARPAVATPAYAAPAQPRLSTTGPAPVVDGSGALAGGHPEAARAPLERATTPQPMPEPVAPQDNMLTLSQAGGTGAWAYYAEQYARLRGCNVTDAGSQLIETRADGEIHKVACAGSNSFLLKCQNGVCRGLE